MVKVGPGLGSTPAINNMRIVALSLQTVRQAHELLILSLVLLRSLLFLSEFLAEFQQTVQRLLGGLRENTPFVLVNENFRN